MTQTPESPNRTRAHSKPSVFRLSQPGITVGTLIMTPKGLRSVEDLTCGDRVLTKDYGYQQVKCVAFRDVDLTRSDDMAPIRLRADALGAERPLEDFYIAPNQRLALRHPLFEAMFGGREVVARAQDLTHLAGVSRVEGLKGITYVMLGFTRSQMVFTGSLVLDLSVAGESPKRPVLSTDEARLACNMIAPHPAAEPMHGAPLH